MPNGDKDQEGFIKVNYRRRKKCCNKPIKSAHHDDSASVCIGSVEEFTKKFDGMKFDMLSSDFLHIFKSLLYEVLVNCQLLDITPQDSPDQNYSVCRDKISDDGVDSSGIAEIVCYGLGSFLSCAIAQYQLALLVILQEMFPTSVVHLYDPVFNIQEINLLQKLNFNVLSYNDEGKKTSYKPTLFFMPHCGKPLYNSVLWSNWSVTGLQKIVIIGNSFTNIVESVPKSEMKESLFYIFQAQPLVLEKPIPNNFRYSDIFNSMSVHAFPSSNLISMPEHFWERAQEPQYTSDDEIITFIQQTNQKVQ